MKRFLVGVIVGAIIATAATAVANTGVIHLVVNGTEIAFPDAPPQMINGRVMVPARPVAEALGAQVTWDGTSQTVTVVSPQPLCATCAPAAVKSLPVGPPTVTVGGTTYVAALYIGNAIRAKGKEDFSGDIVPPPGSTTVPVYLIRKDGGDRYDVAFIVQNGIRYLDPTKLIQAGVVTMDEISAQYTAPLSH